METVHRESTLDEMITELFTNSPKPVNTIKLQTEGLQLKDLFQMLLEIFTKGMKILYGNENGTVDLESITDEQLLEVKQRFRSFGIEIFYQIKPYYQPGDVTDVFDEDVDEDNLPDFNTKDDTLHNKDLNALPTSTEDKLSDFFYTIHCSNADYRIWFDHVDII